MFSGKLKKFVGQIYIPKRLHVRFVLVLSLIIPTLISLFLFSEVFIKIILLFVFIGFLIDLCWFYISQNIFKLESKLKLVWEGGGYQKYLLDSLFVKSSNHGDTFIFKPQKPLPTNNIVSIKSWKLNSGEKVLIDEVICVLKISVDQSTSSVVLKSNMEGVIEIHKPEKLLDINNKFEVKDSDYLFTIHKTQSEYSLNKITTPKFYFNESITKDSFSDLQSIKWKEIFGNNIPYYLNSELPDNKIYTYKDGFLIKKGHWKNDFQLRFTFNYQDENDFIVFKYDVINPRKLKNGSTISFKFNNKNVVHFQISKPYRDNNDDFFLSKSILSESTLDTFLNKKLVMWKVVPSENSKGISGKVNDEMSQTILQKFTSKYLSVVKSNIPKYEEKKKNSLSNSEFTSKNTSETCYVYLMVDKTNNYHKIGISNSPKYREKTLQSEKPTIELVCSKSFINRQMSLSIEQSLHNNYKSKRVRGEWFSLSDQDVEDVKKILS